MSKVSGLAVNKRDFARAPRAANESQPTESEPIEINGREKAPLGLR